VIKHGDERSAYIIKYERVNIQA